VWVDKRRTALAVPLRAKNTNADANGGTFFSQWSFGAREATRGEPMKRLIVVSALAYALAIPAFAQAVTEYYVVQDATTKRCTIVDKKPTTTTTVQVGPVAFKSRSEAESGMKTIKVCETR
jgi:hypothetical protein